MLIVRNAEGISANHRAPFAEPVEAVPRLFLEPTTTSHHARTMALFWSLLLHIPLTAYGGQSTPLVPLRPLYPMSDVPIA